ncbi:MAG: GNAT family N-acetyltransferase [Myxococcales bacterium]|nr:GNAT family N-acetyltransferase [Myxococcales bacterium]
MQRLDFAALAALADEWDALVAVTPAVDRFCTSSAWIVPAQAAFCPDAAPFVARDARGAVAMMTLPIGLGRFGALPLEAGWGLAAPFAGPEPEAVVDLLAELWADPPTPVDALFMSGLPLAGPWLRAIRRRFEPAHRIGIGTRCVRRIADLAGGVDGFLGRRSAKFRANLRRGVRRAREEGFAPVMCRAGEVEPLFERVIAVERRSWKGRQGDGIDSGPPMHFYAMIVERLLMRGALRLLFVQRDGRDVAYVLGGLFGDTYRGLQVSFDDAVAAAAPGNLAQYWMIEALCDEGIARYDLGTDMAYKRRWAEDMAETATIAVVPRGSPDERLFMG